jgi:hypothetical protein
MRWFKYQVSQRFSGGFWGVDSTHVKRISDRCIFGLCVYFLRLHTCNGCKGKGGQRLDRLVINDDDVGATT